MSRSDISFDHGHYERAEHVPSRRHATLAACATSSETLRDLNNFLAEAFCQGQAVTCAPVAIRFCISVPEIAP